MFKIILAPRHSDAVLKLEKSGNVLKINDTAVCFSSMNNGDKIPSDAIKSDWITGDITKENGVLNITIIRPYSNINAPDSVRFPMPIILTEDQIITFNDDADVENNTYPVVELEPEE